MSALEWSPSEVFEISGFELETMVNLLTDSINTKLAADPSLQQLIREIDTLKMLQERIKQGIDNGKVKIKDNDKVLDSEID